jgi:hypothetical protein
MFTYPSDSHQTSSHAALISTSEIARNRMVLDLGNMQNVSWCLSALSWWQQRSEEVHCHDVIRNCPRFCYDCFPKLTHYCHYSRTIYFLSSVISSVNIQLYAYLFAHWTQQYEMKIANSVWLRLFMRDNVKVQHLSRPLAPAIAVFNLQH